MGIIGRLKSLADGAPLFWRHFRLLSSESAHHMRGNTLILILIIKKERPAFATTAQIAKLLLCRWPTSSKIRKEDVSTMTLAAIKCRSILWCNFMINGTPSVSETRKPDKVRLRPGTGALIILISAPLGRGKFRGNSNKLYAKATQKAWL
ncbi:hypothetical protein ACLB1O_07780 [Escherichia coli]